MGNTGSGMKYISTRDPMATAYSFEEVVMRGLAYDGGLFVPETVSEIALLLLASLTLQADPPSQPCAAQGVERPVLPRPCRPGMHHQALFDGDLTLKSGHVEIYWAA